MPLHSQNTKINVNSVKQRAGLELLNNLSEKEYLKLSQNCVRVSKEEFDFHDQIKSLNKFLNNQC